MIPDDKDESALNINGKKRKLKKSDFDTLAANMGINTKSAENIYSRFASVSPIWIAFIKQSFLGKTMQERYIELIKTRQANLFR